MAKYREERYSGTIHIVHSVHVEISEAEFNIKLGFYASFDIHLTRYELSQVPHCCVVDWPVQADGKHVTLNINVLQ